MRLSTILLLSTLLWVQVACVSKVKEMAREVKYSAYETVGLEKRDLFKKQVSEVKEEQADTKEAFTDALTQLKSVYNVDGGKLEKEYNKLKDRYEDADKQAKEVRESITKLQTIAGDLFKEWDKEIQEMSSADLKSKSRTKYTQTRSKYNSYISRVEQSEKKMTPVLKKLNDQVLYLKHNLNASMIGGLKVEADRIGEDINRLLNDIGATSKEADELIGTL